MTGEQSVTAERGRVSRGSDTSFEFLYLNKQIRTPLKLQCTGLFLYRHTQQSSLMGEEGTQGHYCIQLSHSPSQQGKQLLGEKLGSNCSFSLPSKCSLLHCPNPPPTFQEKQSSSDLFVAFNSYLKSLCYQV